jgi:hypothetical protein
MPDDATVVRLQPQEKVMKKLVKPTAILMIVAALVSFAVAWNYYESARVRDMAYRFERPDRADMGREFSEGDRRLGSIAILVGVALLGVGGGILFGSRIFRISAGWFGAVGFPLAFAAAFFTLVFALSFANQSEFPEALAFSAVAGVVAVVLGRSLFRGLKQGLQTTPPEPFLARRVVYASLLVSVALLGTWAIVGEALHSYRLTKIQVGGCIVACVLFALGSVASVLFVVRKGLAPPARLASPGQTKQESEKPISA